MKVTVDFSDWVKSVSSLQLCPRRLFTVHIRTTESQTVYEALEKSYRRLCDGIRHHLAKKYGQGEAERNESTLPDWVSEVYGKHLDAINPFGRSAYRERIGFIWMVTTAGREVYLIDRLGKLLQANGTLSLAVRLRRFQDVERARSLDVLAGLYVDATGQRSSLRAARSYLWPEARGRYTEERYRGFGSVLEAELQRVIGGVLEEPSTVAYIDLAAQFGIFWVEGMHVRSTYPSEIWRQLESLGDAAYLVDAASFHQRSTRLLAEIQTDSVQASPTIRWWLTRQTFLLRHHVTVLLAYPETFYSAASGHTKAQYDSLIQKFVTPNYVAIAKWLKYSGYHSFSSVTPSSDGFCKSYLMHEYPNQCIDIGRVLRQIFHVPRVKNLIGSPNKFNKALNCLYGSSSLVAPTIAIFFKYFRNCIVHGHSFEPRWAKLGRQKVPAGLRFHKDNLVFTIGFDCLLVCWQLLPIVLTELKRNANI